MANYMIIFQEIPENLRIFLCENVSDEDGEKLKRCHNKFIKFINGEDWDESEWLLGFIEARPKSDLLYSDLPAPNHKPDIWEGYLEYTHIIVTGFIL